MHPQQQVPQPKEKWQNLRAICLPLVAIQQHPLLFWAWFLVAVVMGSSGFWFPMILDLLNDRELALTYRQVMTGRVLMGFSVVLIADGLGNLIAAVRAGQNFRAAGVRGIIGSLSMLIMFISAGLSVPSSAGRVTGIIVAGQFLITVASVVCACYLYCLRYPDWEKSADEVRREDDRAVDNINSAATRVTVDGQGVKL